LEVRAATLAAATLVALPLILFYDFMMAAVALAWLVRAGRRSGFLRWEKLVMAAVFLAPMLARGLGASLHLPFGAVAGFALLGLCAARAWREEHALRPAAGSVGSGPQMAFLAAG
jgi:hypothetical protein